MGWNHKNKLRSSGGQKSSSADCNIAGFIFARGGSKGVPGKNLRMLGGKPLVAHAVESALSSRFLSDVYLSTDSAEIAACGKRFGAKIPFIRPQELASDTAPERFAWRHAILEVERLTGTQLDVMVSIPPTCPLRESSDIDRVVEVLLATDADIVVTTTESDDSPYFNMVEYDADGLASVSKLLPQGVTRRQDAPRVESLTAVAYAARRDSVLRHNCYFEGRVRTVLVPKERAVDIDTQSDLRWAEFLWSQRKIAA